MVISSYLPYVISPIVLRFFLVFSFEKYFNAK